MKLTDFINKADKNKKGFKYLSVSFLRKSSTKMKNIFYLFVILPLILISCKSTPEAHFFIDRDQPEVGQDIHFTNDSHNAKRFEWDFGDGYISNDENPTHYYNASGSYEVELTAISKSGLSDKAYLTIDVMIPTLLEIEVVEWYQEYDVPGASVRLYPTLPDWQDETNLEAEGFTDDNGFVVFSHLGPFVYYVDVWEQNHDNWTLASEDVGFIRTPEIMPHRINRFIAWVDVADHGKGSGVRDRSLVIKKLERVPADKIKSIPETEDWQELYDRSIKLK
jgi:hypothetical protein